MRWRQGQRRDDVAGITLPPAGSGHTFLAGCFFRSQGEDRQAERKKKKPSETFSSSQGGVFSSHETPAPDGPWTLMTGPLVSTLRVLDQLQSPRLRCPRNTVGWWGLERADTGPVLGSAAQHLSVAGSQRLCGAQLSHFPREAGNQHC